MKIRRFLFVLLVGTPLMNLWAGILFSEDTLESVQQKLDALPAEGNRSKKALLQTSLGRLLYRQGRFEEAAVAYETALSYNPNRSLKREGYLYLGKSQESSGRPDKALEAYQQAAFYDRKNWRRHRDLAQIYESVLLYPDAVASYITAIKYNPKSPQIYLSLGRTYRKMGLYQEAEVALKKSEGLDHDSAALFHEFSLVCEGSGRFEEAATRQRRALSPSSPIPDWGRLIYLAALAGDKTLANEGLSQIRKRETLPDTVSFYEELVDLIGRKPEARLNASLVDPTLRTLIGAVRAPANP